MVTITEIRTNGNERLEIYKLYANILGKADHRIDLTHRLFFGLISALLAFLIGTILTTSSTDDFFYVLRTSAGAGALFSVFWWFYVRSHHFNRKVKYKALRELEESMAIKFLEREEAIRSDVAADSRPSIRQTVDLIAPIAYFLLFSSLLFVSP